MNLRRRGRAHLVRGNRTEFELVGSTHPPGGVPDPSEFSSRLLGRLGLARRAEFERGDFLVVGRGFSSHPTMDWVALGLRVAGLGGLLGDALDPRLRDVCHHAGVATLVLRGVTDVVADGDDLIVDWRAGTIENVTQHRVLVAPRLTASELQRVHEAPSLAWYDLAPPPRDPDVIETRSPARAASTRP